ncbi:MAG: symmetrical bis(5'-nucleosyl)-tetraphosphatase [Pseudomonadota bacterium]
MAIYAIGDLQGCYDPLLRLLHSLKFDPASDQLWLTGDLVNRGPNSLATLRFVKSLGDSAITVLGNHDLHLLALAERPKRSLVRKRSALNTILHAHDADELLHWLRHRPLLHFDEGRDQALVHAGILPRWSMRKACRRAREVEQVLRGDQHSELLRHMYSNKPAIWRGDLSGAVRWRFIINVFTRMRMITRKGGLDLKTKGTPDMASAYSKPWFRVAHKRRDTEVIFGHWSALGYFQSHGVVGLDSGCVWGRSLTAVRIDKPKREYRPVSVACAGP